MEIKTPYEILKSKLDFDRNLFVSEVVIESSTDSLVEYFE